VTLFIHPRFPLEKNPLLTDIFFWSELLSTDGPPIFEVPASLRKTREQITWVCLEYFCRSFGPKYSRETIMDALATAVCLPTTLSEEMADVPSFLLGAALWILDYVTAQELLDELLGFAPGPSAEADYEYAVYAAPVGKVICSV